VAGIIKQASQGSPAFFMDFNNAGRALGIASHDLILIAVCVVSGQPGSKASPYATQAEMKRNAYGAQFCLAAQAGSL
jgi:hypothetical protein